MDTCNIESIQTPEETIYNIIIRTIWKLIIMSSDITHKNTKTKLEQKTSRGGNRVKPATGISCSQ